MGRVGEGERPRDGGLERLVKRSLERWVRKSLVQWVRGEVRCNAGTCNAPERVGGGDALTRY